MTHRLPHIVLLQAHAQSATRAYSLSGREETYSCLTIIINKKRCFSSAVNIDMDVHKHKESKSVAYSPPNPQKPVSL